MPWPSTSSSSGFDLKQLIRAIMTSRLYQLDSQPTAANAADEKFYSHYQVKRLPAESRCSTRSTP